MPSPRHQHTRRRRRALAAAALLLPSPALATVYDLTNKSVNLNTATYTAADTLNASNTVFTATTNAATTITLPAALNIGGNPTGTGAGFNATGNMTLTGPLSGTGHISKVGTGTLTLAGDGSAFTGRIDNSVSPLVLAGNNAAAFASSININSNGTLRLANPTALGAGPFPPIQVTSGAVDLNGYTPHARFDLTASGRVVNDNTATPVTLDWQFIGTTGYALNLGGAGDMTFAANYPTLSSYLYKSGTGTLTYSTRTAFTQAPYIDAGTLRLGIESPFTGTAGPYPMNVAGNLDLNGFNSAGVPASVSGSLVNNNTAAPSTVSPSTIALFPGSLGGAGALDVTAPVPTTASFTKVGAGTLTLSADNTSYAGTITVAAGSLRLGNPAGAGNSGSGTNNFPYSTVAVAAGAEFDLNGFTAPRVQVKFNGGALVNNNTASPAILPAAYPLDLPYLSTGTGPITLGGTGEIIANRSLSNVTKTGPGPLTLNLASGAAGAWIINGGTLRLGTPNPFASGATVTANPGGALDLNGLPLSASLPLTLNDGGIVNNNTATPVTLTSFPTIASGKLNPAVGGAGTLALNFSSLPTSSVTLNKIGAGLLTLAPSFTGSLNGPRGWKLVGGTLLAETDAQLGGATGTVTFAGGTLRIAPNALPDPGSYTFNAAISVDPLAGGTIDTQRDTTFTGSLNDVGTLVKTGTGTLTFNKPFFQAGVGFTVNQGKLNVPSTSGLLDWSFLTLNVDDGLTYKGNYRLGGLAGSANLTGYFFTLVGPPSGSPARSSTFSGNLSGGGVTLTGTAQLTVTGSLAGTTTVNAGTLTLGDGGTTGTLSGSPTVGAAGTLALNRSDDFTLSGGIFGSGALVKRGPGSATVSLASTSRLKLDVQAGTLRLRPSLFASQITSLTFAATGNPAFDLSSTDLVLNYTGTSPLPAIRQYLTSHQLFSSTADADPQHLLTLACAEASALLRLTGTQTAFWRTQLVDATSLLFRSVPFGDANMDGVINADDYLLLDRSFAAHPADPQWTDGDFNADHTIDANDYLLLDRSSLLLSHTTPSPDFLATRESQFGPDYVSQLLTSVPEPSSAACLFAGSFLARRRRR